MRDDQTHEAKGREFLQFEKWVDGLREGSKTHPGLVESMIPVWGPARESVADFQEGDIVGGVVNGALAGVDLLPIGAVGGALFKEAKFAKSIARSRAKAPLNWRAKRRWIGKEELVEKYQPVHHGIIAQARKVDDRWTNHLLNLKPTNTSTHQRIHGNHPTLSQYGLPRRLWHGLPDWTKITGGAALGHGATAADIALEDED